MQRTANQKILLVFSIIEIVVAAIAIIAALFICTGGTLLIGGIDIGPIVDDVPYTSTAMGGVAMIVGAVILFAGVIDLIIGILGVRAANDASKITPVWVLAIIEVVIGGLSLISSLANNGDGSSIASGVVSLALSIIVLIVANNIKKESKVINVNGVNIDGQR